MIAYKMKLDFDVSTVDEGFKVYVEGKKKCLKESRQLLKEVVEQAIMSAHPTGNTQSLNKTLKILNQFNNATKVITLSEDDYKYIKSSFDKADKWNNNLKTAHYLKIIGNIINSAEKIELNA